MVVSAALPPSAAIALATQGRIATFLTGDRKANVQIGPAAASLRGFGAAEVNAASGRFDGGAAFAESA